MSALVLKIALPSKGRIHDKTVNFLADASFSLERNGASRGYTANLKPLEEAEVTLLSAGEVAAALEAGRVQVGITGRDLLEERAGGLGGKIEILRPLGFAKAQVVVAVPTYWLDVETMADLVDVSERFVDRHEGRMRVATKFRHLTRRFFSEHGLIDYRIIESLGATEGAPASGTADIIVDITETGSTLKANQLKLLADGTMLKSEAVLAVSLAADWPVSARAALRQLITMIEARAASRAYCEVHLRGGSGQLKSALSLAEALGARPASPEADPAVVLCPRPRVYALIDRLRAEGLEATVSEPEFVFLADDGAYARFETALSAAGRGGRQSSGR